MAIFSCNLKKHLRAFPIAMGLWLPLAAEARFPVIGYFPTYRGNPADIEYEKLTHINYSFINTSSGGEISGINDGRLRDLVRLGHAKGTKIALAIGGWGAGTGTGNFSAMAANAQSRANFIKNLVKLLEDYDADGIDMDWEYPDAGSAANFETMMKELGTALHAKGKFLSAAVIDKDPELGKAIRAGVLEMLDFLNVMAYDSDGPNHSSYELAVAAINYWTVRGCAKHKIILGVPFYGRSPEATYSDILRQDGQAHTKDNVGGIGYNGIPTLEKKTQLAHDKAGGIMIWEITQDVTGEKSLLGAIHKKAGAFPTALEHRISVSPRRKDLNLRHAASLILFEQSAATGKLPVLRAANGRLQPL